jgi:hypothetical protein
MATISRTPGPEVVSDLENQLKFSLRPVQPNPEFVNRLHNRLTSPPSMTVEREQTALGLLVIAISLLTGVLLIFTLRQFRPHHQQ